MPKSEKTSSKQVGFRLDGEAFDVYAALALADRDRPVGTMCGLILKAVLPIAALLEADRELTADDILKKAGLDGQAQEALRKLKEAQEARA